VFNFSKPGLTVWFGESKRTKKFAEELVKEYGYYETEQWHISVYQHDNITIKNNQKKTIHLQISNNYVRSFCDCRNFQNNMFPCKKIYIKVNVIDNF